MPETRISVKLEDILPNPYRDLDFCPISEVKVKRLSQSIRDTGFWKNLNGRRNEAGKIEIVFGHNRLEALKRLYGPTLQVEILLMDLSDRDMMRMMLNENDEEYNCSVASVDNAIRAARNYLSEHDEAALTSVGPEVKRIRVGAPMIANFLSMPVNRVEKTIERLNAIERGNIDPKALYLLPTASAADTFIKLVYESRIDPEHQPLLAKYICASKRFGYLSMKENVCRFECTLPFDRPAKYLKPSGQDERRLKGQISVLRKLKYFLNEVCQDWDLDKDFREGEVSDQVKFSFLGYLEEVQGWTVSLESKLKDKITHLDLEPAVGHLEENNPKNLLFIEVRNLGFAPMVINAPYFELPDGARFIAPSEACDITFPYKLEGRSRCRTVGVDIQELGKFYTETIGRPTLRFRLGVEDSTGRVWRTTEIWRKEDAALKPEKRNRGIKGEKVTGRKRQLESLESRNALRARLGLEPIEPREKKAKRSNTPPVPATHRDLPVITPHTAAQAGF